MSHKKNDELIELEREIDLEKDKLSKGIAKTIILLTDLIIDTSKTEKDEINYFGEIYLFYGVGATTGKNYISIKYKNINIKVLGDEISEVAIYDYKDWGTDLTKWLESLQFYYMDWLGEETERKAFDTREASATGN